MQTINTKSTNTLEKDGTGLKPSIEEEIKNVNTSKETMSEKVDSIKKLIQESQDRIPEL